MSAAKKQHPSSSDTTGFTPHSAEPFSSLRTSTAVCEWPELKYAYAPSSLIYGTLFFSCLFPVWFLGAAPLHETRRLNTRQNDPHSELRPGIPCILCPHRGVFCENIYCFCNQEKGHALSLQGIIIQILFYGRPQGPPLQNVM